VMTLKREGGLMYGVILAVVKQGVGAREKVHDPQQVVGAAKVPALVRAAVMVVSISVEVGWKVGVRWVVVEAVANEEAEEEAEIVVVVVVVYRKEVVQSEGAVGEVP